MSLSPIAGKRPRHHPGYDTWGWYDLWHAPNAEEAGVPTDVFRRLLADPNQVNPDAVFFAEFGTEDKAIAALLRATAGE